MASPILHGLPYPESFPRPRLGLWNRRAAVQLTGVLPVNREDYCEGETGLPTRAEAEQELAQAPPEAQAEIDMEAATQARPAGRAQAARRFLLSLVQSS